MSQVLTDKLRLTQVGTYAHWCPGCNSVHLIPTVTPTSSGALWVFNGNVDSPTFTPSMHISVGPWDDEQGHHPKQTLCHYFLTNGKLIFLSDCSHDLKGQTVDLPDLPVWKQ